MIEGGTDIFDQHHQLVYSCMHRRQVQRGLPGMPDRPAHTGQQQGAARDRLHLGAKLGCPALPTPPVVHQPHGPGAALAALDALGREAAPAPLVIQLIKAVLAIGPVPVKLAKHIQGISADGHRHHVLLGLHVLVRHQQLDLLARLVLGFAAHRQIRFNGPTQHHDPARLVPAGELQGIFNGAPALIAGPRCTPGKLATEQELDAPGLAQLEQVEMRARSNSAMMSSLPKPQSLRTRAGRCSGVRLSSTAIKPGRALPALCSFPRETTTSITQTQVADPSDVQVVAGASGLARVVTDLDILLLAEQRLDGAINV
jgi:hypothetical protein